MATSRAAFLINNLRPDLAVSPVFVVGEGGVRISASGIVGEDYVRIDKQTSPVTGAFAAIWTPLVRQGQVVRLSVNNIEHMELVSGAYRAVFVGATPGDVVVYMAEDQALLDSKIMYTYPAYNPAFNGAVTGTALSPALVGSRERLGGWEYDVSGKVYVWREAVVDTSTGAVTYEYFDVPGGTPIAAPSAPIQQPLEYPSSERLFFDTVTSVGGALDFTGFLSGHAAKKITILVDAGQFTLAGKTGSITVSANEVFTFEVGSNMGRFTLDYIGPDTPFLVLTPVNGGGDSARVIVQACRVSPE